MSASDALLALLNGKCFLAASKANRNPGNASLCPERLFKQLKVYVASNWNECKLERRTLFDEVLPRLRRYGLQFALDISFIDLQCGAPYDHALDTQALSSHLEELEECDLLSCGPCFICLMNERSDVGEVMTPVLPATISTDAASKLRCGATAAAHDLFDKWYRKTENGFAICSTSERFPQIMNIDAEKNVEALKIVRQEHKTLADLLSKHFQLKSAIETEVDRALEICPAKSLFVFHASVSTATATAAATATGTKAAQQNGTASSTVQRVKQRVLGVPSLSEAVITLRSNIDSSAVVAFDSNNSEPSDDDADDVATFQRSFSDQVFSRLLRIIDSFWSKSSMQNDSIGRLLKQFDSRNLPVHSAFSLLNNLANCVFHDETLPLRKHVPPADCKWTRARDDARNVVRHEFSSHVKTIGSSHSALVFRLAAAVTPAESNDAVTVPNAEFLSEHFVVQQLHEAARQHFATVNQNPLFLVLDAGNCRSRLDVGMALLDYCNALGGSAANNANLDGCDPQSVQSDDAVTLDELECFNRAIKRVTELARSLLQTRSVLVVTVLNMPLGNYGSLVTLLTGKVPANTLFLVTVTVGTNPSDGTGNGTRIAAPVHVGNAGNGGSGDREAALKSMESWRDEIRTRIQKVEAKFQTVSESCHYAFRLILQLIAMNVDGIEEAHVYDFLRQAAMLSTESHELYAIWMWHTLKNELLQLGVLETRFFYSKIVFCLASPAARDAVQQACFQTRNMHDPPDTFRWLHRSMLSHLYQLDELHVTDTKRDSCTSMKTTNSHSSNTVGGHRLSHISALKALPKISSFDADEIFEARTKQRRQAPIALQYAEGEYNVSRLQFEWFHFLHAKNADELSVWFNNVFGIERQLAVAHTMSVDSLINMLDVIAKHVFTSDVHILRAIYRRARRVLLENPSQLAAEVFLHAQQFMSVTQPQNGAVNQQRNALLNALLQQCIELHEKRDEQISLVPLTSWIKPIKPKFDIQIESACGSGPAALLQDNQHLYWITDANKKVTKYNLASGESVKCLERLIDKQFTCLSFSNDDSKLYVGASDCTVRQYSTRNEELQHIYTGHRDAVTCLAVTLDGKLLCSGSKDKTVRIYNTGNKQLVSSTAVHDGSVRCVLFSKSAQLTVTGGADFKVKVWFVEDMTLMHVFEEYVTPITAMVLTPDTSFLLIACEDKRLSVKSLISGKDVHELETIQEYATSLSVSSDCHHVSVGCADAFTYIYNLRTMDLIQRIPPPVVTVQPAPLSLTPSTHRASVSSLTCHESPIRHSSNHATRTLARAMSVASPVVHSSAAADATSITASTESGLVEDSINNASTTSYPCAACDRAVRNRTCYDYPSAAHSSPGAKINNDAVKSVQFTRCGQNVLITQRGCVRLVRVNLPSRMQMFVDSFQHTRKVTCICLSRDGRIAATGSDDSLIKIWNMMICDFVVNLIGHDGGIQAMQISNDEQFLVSAGLDRRCIVWNTQNGRIFLKYTEHDADVMQIALFGEDDEYGIRCVSMDMAGVTKLWRIDTGETFLTVKSLHFTGLPIAITANFQLVVSSTSAQSLAICMLSDGRVMQQISHKERITCFTLSKDSQYIVTGSVDTSLKVWQARTGRLTQVLAEHESAITCVAITENNQRVVSGSNDCTAIIWDVSTGAVCTKLTAHRGSVTQVRLTQDTNIVLTASLDKTVRIWSLHSGMQLTWFYVHYPVIDIQATFDGSRILLRLEGSCNLAVLSLRVTDKYLERIEQDAPKVPEVQPGAGTNANANANATSVPVSNLRARLQRSMTMPANVIPQDAAASPGSACIAYRHRQSPFKQTTLINMFRQQEKSRQQRLQNLLRRTDAWLLGSRVSLNSNRSSTKVTTACTML